MSTTTATTPTPQAAAPDLAQLREQLRAAVDAYPDLRQGLCAALSTVERRLGVTPPPSRRDRRRVGGLR